MSQIWVVRGLYEVLFTYNRKPKMDDIVAEMWQDSG